MKILVISDTHCLHKDFLAGSFEDINMVIHAGDVSNNRSPTMNYHEVIDFLDWYSKLPVKHKILIAGNHDTSIEARLVTPADIASRNIIYLEHSSTIVEGVNIFGSPFTPSYGQWSFMKDRSKLDKYWQSIPENTDILVTHGPPKGILDLYYNKDGLLEYCGDKALFNHVLRVKPRHHIFGHIHNYEDCYNSGSKKIDGLCTSFHNVSCVTDRKFNLGLTSRGQIINYE